MEKNQYLIFIWENCVVGARPNSNCNFAQFYNYISFEMKFIVNGRHENKNYGAVGFNFNYFIGSISRKK